MKDIVLNSGRLKVYKEIRESGWFIAYHDRPDGPFSVWAEGTEWYKINHKVIRIDLDGRIKNKKL